MPEVQGTKKRIKAAFHVFIQSLTSPSYYKELIKTNLKFSLKYYIVLGFIFTLATSINTLIPLMPKIDQGIEDAIAYTHNLFEDDLVITVEGGKLTLNKEDPYVVSLPTEASGVPENVLVYDSEGTLDDLDDKYDTIILVNQSNFLVKSEDKVEVYPVSTLPEGEFTKEDLVFLTDAVSDFANFVPYIVGFALFLATLSYYLVFRLVYLLFIAVLLWMLGAFRGLNLPYGKYYKVALHAITLPLCLELLNNFFRVSIPGLPWFVGLHLIFGIVVVFQLEDFPEEAGLSESD